MKMRARSDEEKLAKKELILESAKRLFSRYGYQGTTIEMITEDASLSPAAFYLYFRNKIDIYRTLTALGISVLENIILAEINKPGMKPSEKILGVANAYLDYFKNNREYYNITEVLHLGQGDFFVDLDMVPDLENQARNILKLFSSIIEDGMNSGEFRKVDSWKTAVTLWGMMDGVVLMEVKGSTGFLDVSLEDLLIQMAQIVLDGLYSENKGYRK